MAVVKTGLKRGKRLTIIKDDKTRCPKCLMPAFAQDEFCVRCGQDFYEWTDTRCIPVDKKHPELGGMKNDEMDGNDYPGM